MKRGVFAAVLLAAGIVQAGAAELTRVSTWGGPDAEVVEGSAVAADGSVVVAGTTFGSDADIFVVKYDAAGDVTWRRRWAQSGAFANDNAGDVAVDATGAVYVVGTTFVSGRSNEVVLLKFDSSGTLVWQQTFGGTIQDSGDSIAISSLDGGIYVAGTIGFDNPQAFVAKFDSTGAVLWQQAWSRGGSAFGRALAVDGFGNVYLAGTTGRADFSGADLVLLRFDGNGSLLDEKAYTVSDFAEPNGLAVGESGHVHAVGHIDGAASAFVLRFAPDLSLEWQRAIDGRSGDRANSVTVASDGTIWIVGETNTADAGDEAFIVQMSARARVLQDNLWGGAGNDQGIDLGFGPDGILNVAAHAQDPPWAFRASRLKASRLRGTVADALGTVADSTGERLPANGVVTDAGGVTTFGGQSDAALLKIVP